MALESATRIDELNTSNPVDAVDTVASLGDHVRLIKTAIKGTFANVTGAVTSTHTELNYTDGVTSNIQTQLDAKAPLASPALTGAPTAPTPAAGTNTTQLATMAALNRDIAAAAMSATTPTVASDAGKFWGSDGVNAAWSRAGIIRSARTANAILAVADHATLIDVTSGTFTQTFPTAATLGSGWYCFYRNSGTGIVAFDPNGTETIDAVTSFLMYPGECRLVHCDGAAFHSVVLTAFAQTYTASDNFIKPPGYNAFAGMLWGGGGSGVKNDTVQYKSGGGGGGCALFHFAASALAATEVVTIGAGGLAQASVGDGNAGGNSSLGSLVTAYGGAGGKSDASANAAIASGGGAYFSTSVNVAYSVTSSVPDGYLSGGSGSSNTAGKSIYGGGAGDGFDNATTGTPATSVFGGAGGATSAAGAASAGTAPGGGGGATRTGTSGAGARGELRIWGVV